MKTKIIISKDASDQLLNLVNEAIQEELRYPAKSDHWMDNMQEAQRALKQADDIVTGE